MIAQLNQIESSDDKQNVYSFIENKNKTFNKYFKLNSNTLYYRPTEKDDFSLTMFAYYFRDKSCQIFSDKEATALKSIPLNPISCVNLMDYNNKLNDDISLNSSHHNSKKSRRHYNEQINNSQKKIGKNSVPKACIDAELEDENDGNYCIEKCKYERKSKNKPMIQCGKCNIWYHTECLGFTDDYFSKVKDQDWICKKCEKLI